MAFSINDVLRELDVELNDPTPTIEKVAKLENAETLEPEKVAEYLESLASPDSILDELAKLAVLQDWVEAHGVNSDDLLDYSMEFRDDRRISMLKAASLTVRAMQRKLAELEDRETRRNHAVKIAQKMYSAGHIDRGSILDKVAELTQQSLEELHTLDKALDLTKKSNGTLTFGSLSDQSNNSENPLLDYILS
jgi:hypothetical protein